jgi:hypothetical protein
MQLIIIMGMFSYLGFNNYNNYSEFKILKKIVIIDSNINRVVHYLQQERCASVGYIGSDDVKHKLKYIRNNVDIEYMKLKKSVKDKSNFTTEMKEKYENADRMYSQIQDKRNKIDNLEITVPEVIKYFSNINVTFLDVVKLSKDLSNDNEFSKLLTNIISISRVKELASKEKAVMTGIFGTDKFNKGIFAKFQTLVALQRNNIKALEILNCILDNQVFIDVKSMSNINIFKNKEGNFSIDTVTWFETIDKKINRLEKMEYKFEEILLSYTSNISNFYFNNILFDEISEKTISKNKATSKDKWFKH